MYQRMRDFYDIIAANPNLTEREICNRVGLRKTPYSRKILMDLVANGDVARVHREGAERLTYVYFVQETEQLL